ncbi:MAG: aldehyde dehydrogenase family protein, partial [Actinomycetes bacterium]
RNGGAACTSANRFYVAQNIVKDFTAKLSKEMLNLKVGNGLEKSTQLGAYVSIKEREKISGLVNASINTGAKVEVGANTPNLRGAFYNPTVLSVSKDNLILEKEIFGPVAPIVTFKTDDQAIQFANATEYGLISYVFSGNLSRALKVAEALESGMVAINRGVISDPAAPFGGYKQSGLGREGGFDGINEFMETKYIGVEI